MTFKNDFFYHFYSKHDVLLVVGKNTAAYSLRKISLGNFNLEQVKQLNI